MKYGLPYSFRNMHKATYLPIRFREEEREIIRRAATVAQQSVSAFIRTVALEAAEGITRAPITATGEDN